MTPVLAVLQELKRHDPELKAYFVTDRKFARQAADIIAKAPFKVGMKRIHAGKFRRYHKIGKLKQLLHAPTTLQNIRDIAYVSAGFLQSVRFLRKVKPDVVFTKGGFVCLPVGLAAKALGIPLVIHDSDAHPGLTNRILAKYATVIGTGAPLENYNYPEGRTHYVGIPVNAGFRPVSAAYQRECKGKLGLHDTRKPLLVVTGGGLGSRNLNRVVAMVAGRLLDKIAIVHYTGNTNYQETIETAPEHIDYIIKPFVASLETAFAAADVVVTRAGATAVSELAAMAKPAIIVPSPHLAGGHQLKNAEVFHKARAAIVLQEEDIILDGRKLAKAVAALVASPEKRKLLGGKLHTFAKPEAALDMAALIAEVACTHNHKRT